MAVKALPYKSPVKRVQSSIQSELIMADFPYLSVMKKVLRIGVSIVWNLGHLGSLMQGKYYFQHFILLSISICRQCYTTIKNRVGKIAIVPLFSAITTAIANSNSGSGYRFSEKQQYVAVAAIDFRGKSLHKSDSGYRFSEKQRQRQRLSILRKQ